MQRTLSPNSSDEDDDLVPAAAFKTPPQQNLDALNLLANEALNGGTRTQPTNLGKPQQATATVATSRAAKTVPVKAKRSSKKATQATAAKKTSVTNTSVSNSTKKKTTHFSEMEVDGLLDIMEEVLPVGHTQWEVVVDKFSSRFGMGRDKESLQKKYRKLHQTQVPTGNPHCPNNVVRAKRIFHQLIGGKASATNMDEKNAELDDLGIKPETMGKKGLCPPPFL